MKNKLAMAALALAVVIAGSGLAVSQDGRYYDHDESYRRGLNVARDFGSRDGAQVAREDMSGRKPFNPNPRGRFDHADHGYRRELGDKREYQEQYSAAYRDGYKDAFRDRADYR